MTLLRYPGSKAKLVDTIARRWLPAEFCGELFGRDMLYVEPFFGAGAFGLDVLTKLHRSCAVWINDIDPGMYALWKMVATDPAGLCNRIMCYEPSVEDFYRFRDEPQSVDIGEAAIRQLALHQMSFSGLGAMAGGPIGGRNQRSQWNVACRWNPEARQEDVREYATTLRRFKSTKVTNLDFGDVLSVALSNPRSFCYIDPPYVVKGPELYRYALNDADHERLARMLRGSNRWVLSYDDCPLVRDLYSWAQIHPIEITYTGAVARGKRPKNKEVVIVP